MGIASYAYRQHDLAEVIRNAQKLNVKKLALKSMRLPLESSEEEIETITAQIAKLASTSTRSRKSGNPGQSKLVRPRLGREGGSSGRGGSAKQEQEGETQHGWIRGF